MTLAAVADSTVLIGLERIGHLDVLRAVFSPLFVPPEVYVEFGVKVSWLVVVEYSDKALFGALCESVDVGEAAAMTRAHEKNLPVILDDLQARSTGRRIGLTITGTLGVLIRAKRNGIITKTRPILDELDQAGFYLDNTLREEALRLAGE